ncbi:glutamate ABC transporter substrate-binding protein [Arthrobacter sp. zg-Y1143]|uniref:glutamate ABC transporter substrate-binding protein n=1 Tax=Arthrobacter sp. zg-Y1143 TaxID=3049065 RepID=UPI0024C2E90D|nr:glutamate ABC transporter substrate-binding protein [Arthrobacter sp. zg-Y1143]MDK1327379.1 glutamate ABC transporter substrate-binding protein [Arthrobacter sp. zg-Y1143]
MRSTSPFRRLLPAVLALTALLSVSACGGGDTAVPGAEAGSSTQPSNLEEVYANAVVADAAAILPESTMARIKERGTLIVGAALDAPLLSQQDPANPESIEGFDADLAKLLAIYILGEPNIKIVPPASETREALLQNGTVDVVFNTYTITEERAEQISFAGPYLESGLAVAVKGDNQDINGIDDLGGKTVIVGANTPAVTAVPEKQPTATLVSFGTDPQALQALKQGRGDAYVQDFTLLASHSADDTSIKVVGQPFTTESYGIGLKHDDEEFKAFINEWLQKIQADGTWGKVWDATLGEAVEAEAPSAPEIGSVPGS